MALAPSYKKPGYTAVPSARFGRPSRNPKVRFESYTWSRDGGSGSHMPIDTAPHWNWRNPLNIIPALMLVLFLFALVGTLVVA